MLGANHCETTQVQGDNCEVHLSRFGPCVLLSFFQLGDLKRWQFLRGLPNLYPPTYVLNLPFPKNSASESAVAEKKEGRADEDPPPYQAPLGVGRGAPEVAIDASILSTISDGELMCEPFSRHSKNQVPPL